MSTAGKGDRPRPVDKKKFDENYDNIFRKKVKSTNIPLSLCASSVFSLREMVEGYLDNGWVLYGGIHLEGKKENRRFIQKVIEKP